MAGEEPKALIEVSSEAGRKIGGIYTVIRSKAPYFHKKFGEGYLLVGMLDEKCAEDVRFEEPVGALAQIFSELSTEGIECRCGKWLYGDNTRIISVGAKKFGERVVDFEDGKPQRDIMANYIKYLLWKNFGIDSLMEKSWDFTENVVWGAAVGLLLEKLLGKGLFKADETVLQFHEWITGSALLYCKMRGVAAPTVFTTHATVLGRTLASAGIDVYSEAAKATQPISLNVAYQNRVEGKHQLEVAAAKQATVFTTVSETVADEVKYILGREADVITVNGIEYAKERNERQVYGLSKYARKELQQFLESCFISYYPQRYDNALFVYISGRYEFTNKGFDLFISALGKLNKKLMKAGKNERRVFGFIFAPSSVKGPKISVIKNYLLLDKINEIMEQIPQLRAKPYVNLQNAIAQLDGEIRHDVENMARGFYKDGEKPHINVYDLSYQNDAIISACVAAGLDNRRENVVKVIFYPTYMKPNDGLMNLNYYDVIAAMDVGVFPSRYEPFGYTPVEAAVAMDIAITSDMTGFGRFIMKKAGKGSGVKVLRMAGRSSDAAAEELACELERIYRLSPKKLEEEKTKARRLMKYVDWGVLVKNYYRAYSLAMRKSGKGV
ncbi:MAG: glycogen/starch synthase [Candidatus Micrarchaeota archaeon]|nr:glycogen/starch synthase [Candidatus Micrarchaeota archaeon]